MRFSNGLLPLMFFLVFTLFLSFIVPLTQDENLHSIIMYEQTKNPLNPVPTLFDYAVSWKPFLFFIFYSLFYSLPFSAVVALRLPTLIFGFVSLILTKKFFENLKFSELHISVILWMIVTSISFIYSSYAIHPDMMLNFMVLLSLVVVSSKEVGKNQFLLISILVFISVFIKTVFALLIPFLCFFYLLFRDREKLYSFYFWLIPFAFFAAVATHFFILESFSEGLGIQTYYTDVIFTHLVHGFDPLSKLITVLGGIQTIFETQLIWLVLSIFGFVQNYKKYPFFSFWYLLCVPLVISQMFAPWYFLPVIIPISFFALSFFSRKNPDLSFIDFDKFEKVIISLFIVCSAILLFYQFFDVSLYRFGNQKIAGEFLANKENVLIIGDYAPGIIGHKMHDEIKSTGKPLDFGWFFNLNQSDFAKNIPLVYYNYSSEIPNTKTGSFTDLYFVNSNFRKESNLTHFRYVAFVNNENLIPNGTLIMNLSEGSKKILIYEFPQLNSSLK